MKVFNITYDNPPRQGTATVQSATAEKACTLLQSYGHLNAGRYSITSVTELGC